MLKTTDAPVSRRHGVRFLRYSLIAVILFAWVFLLPVSARTTENAYGSVTVTAAFDTKNNSDVLVTMIPDAAFLGAKRGETVYLFALRPSEETSAAEESTPVATASVSEKTVFTVRDDGSGERLYMGYRAAVKEDGVFRMLNDPVYLSNPEVQAKNTAPRAENPGIKGFCVSQNMVDEAVSLGISHAVIPIPLDRYLSVDRSDADYFVSFGGVAVNFDKQKIRQLDAEVASLRSAGVQILFRFVLDGSAKGTQTGAGPLYAPAAADGASLYAVTVYDRASYLLLRGVFTYFAERYAADASQPQTDFIIGYQVNERDEWNSCGRLTDAEYAALYAKTFRIADAALRSVSANSRVYVPVSDLYVSAKPFLAAFAKEMDGNAWNVAAAPYASNPKTDAVWDDPGSVIGENGDPVYLTVENLSVLKAFLSGQDYLWHNALRSVIIDDYAVHGNAADDMSQQRQAASAAYAYYQAASADFIDAFIWHRRNDAAAEGCSYGLCASDGTPKAVYEIFRRMDTDLGEDMTKTLVRTIGEKRWNALIEGFSYKKVQTAVLAEETAVDPALAEKRYTGRTWFDFTENTLHGFIPFANTESAVRERVPAGAADGIRDAILRFTGYENAAGTPAGIICGTTSLLNGFDGAAAVGVTLKAHAPDGAGTASVTLRLGNRTGDAALFTAAADVPAEVWTTVVFPLQSFARQTDRAEFLILSVSGDRDGSYGADVNEFLLYDSRTAWVVTVFRVVFVLLILAVVFFLVMWIRKKLLRRKRRREAMEARRRYLEYRRREEAARNAGQGSVQKKTQMPAPPAAQKSMPRTAQQTPGRQMNGQQTHGQQMNGQHQPGQQISGQNRPAGQQTGTASGGRTAQRVPQMRTPTASGRIGQNRKDGDHR